MPQEGIFNNFHKLNWRPAGLDTSWLLVTGKCQRRARFATQPAMSPGRIQLASRLTKMPEKGAFDNLTEANRQPAGRIQLAGGYRKLPEKGMICKSAGRRPATSSWLVAIGKCQRRA